ncbi:MAG: minor structural protein [Bacteriophage sp.]|nr:MAG: minor structural protein [Bacteriophage sp.]UWG70161.1 MAG: minor structural protein [Bacteriophage sp.]UWG88665.1 MAG: minor structural protein [Bacteriophage sp.]
MEREFLEKQGLNADQISAVMSQYGKDVNGIKDDYESKISSLNGNVETLKGQVTDRDKQIKDLSSAAKDNEELKEKFTNAQKEIAESDKKYKAQLLDQKKDFAIQQALTKAGAYNNKAVMAILDADQISVDDKGNILHVEDAVKQAQKDFPQGFKPQETEEATKPTPKVVATGNATSETATKKPSEMTLEEQTQLYKQDPQKWSQLFDK